MFVKIGHFNSCLLFLGKASADPSSSLALGDDVAYRDKTRVQIPAKMFPHLKLLFWLFLGFDTQQRNSFLIKFGVFLQKNKILTMLFITKYEIIKF